MLNSSTSVWLGITFVLIGAINVWLILQVSARVRDTKASARLIAAHRIGGDLFISPFCVVGGFFVAPLGDGGGRAPPRNITYCTFAVDPNHLPFLKG